MYFFTFYLGGASFLIPVSFYSGKYFLNTPSVVRVLFWLESDFKSLVVCFLTKLFSVLFPPINIGQLRQLFSGHTISFCLCSRLGSHVTLGEVYVSVRRIWTKNGHNSNASVSESFDRDLNFESMFLFLFFYFFFVLKIKLFNIVFFLNEI